MLFNIYLIFSILADLLITVFGDLINSFADIWKPILLFVGLFFVCLIINVIMILVVVPFAKKEGEIVESVRWVTLNSIDVFLRLLRVKVHVTGMEMMPENERFLLVCNHKTFFDPIIGLRVYKDYRLAFISKKENLKIPIGNKIIKGMGCVSLDREDDRAAVKTILQASKLIKSGEMSMGIYPEGKTNRTDELLLNFRNGAFKIAQRAGAPIVVTTIFGTEHIKKRMFFRRTDIYVDVLDVLPHEAIVGINTDEIGNRVHDIMLENLKKRLSEVR